MRPVFWLRVTASRPGCRRLKSPQIALKRQYIPPNGLAFTLAPHLQPINHGGRFSPIGGI
jgi:hypothetical protein